MKRKKQGKCHQCGKNAVDWNSVQPIGVTAAGVGLCDACFRELRKQVPKPRGKATVVGGRRVALKQTKADEKRQLSLLDDPQGKPRT